MYLNIHVNLDTKQKYAKFKKGRKIILASFQIHIISLKTGSLLIVVCHDYISVRISTPIPVMVVNQC